MNMRYLFAGWAATLTIFLTGANAQNIAQTWQSNGLTVKIQARAVGNLAWQLDTLANHTNTRPKDYEDFWHTDLAWSAADDLQLKKWKRLYDRYRHQNPRNTKAPSPYPQNFAAYYGASVSRELAYRIAAFDALDLTQLRASYRHLCGDACAGRMIDVLRYFQPRFLSWWQKEGIATSSKIMPALAGLMTEQDLASLYLPEARIVGADVSGAPPETLKVETLDMVVHPRMYLNNYTATIMDDHIIYEVVDDPEVGGARLPLLVHELMHHFYELATPAAHTHLVERFAARPEPWSMAAYSLLNETLAASFQALLEKRSRTPEEFETFLKDDDNIYFDPSIAKIARAIIPLVERMIATNQTIFDDTFVNAYMEAAAAGLGPLRDSPRFLLSTRVLRAEPSERPAKDTFDRAVRGMVGQDSWIDLKASPLLSGVVFLTPASLPRLHRNAGVLPPTVVNEILRATQKRDAFCFAWRRSPKAMIYFLYGNDEDTLLKQVETFAANNAPFTVFFN